MFTLKRTTVVAVFALVLTSFGTFGFSNSVHAQANVTKTMLDVPINLVVWNKCTNEWVDVVGDMLFTSIVRFDNEGGFHIKVHLNWQGVRGTGQSSGDLYHGMNVSNFETTIPSTFVSFPLITTNEVMSRMMHPGPRDDLVVRSKAHTTINANGETTVDFSDDAEVVCQ